MKPGTVFDTGHQRVFHLVGYAPILPVRFGELMVFTSTCSLHRARMVVLLLDLFLFIDHVAWRTHNLEKLRFIHSEVNLRYFRMGQQDYLRDQHICFAIYRSAVSRKKP